MKRKRCLQSGLSMLEILVTMFIVMVGLLVVMTSFVAISKSHKYSEKMEVATTIGRMEMERIRNTTYSNVRSEEGAYREYAEYPTYRHSVTVVPVGSVKSIVVRVYFEHDRRRAEFRTYMSNM